MKSDATEKKLKSVAELFVNSLDEEYRVNSEAIEREQVAARARLVEVSQANSRGHLLLRLRHPSFGLRGPQQAKLRFESSQPAPWEPTDMHFNDSVEFNDSEEEEDDEAMARLVVNHDRSNGREQAVAHGEGQEKTVSANSESFSRATAVSSAKSPRVLLDMQLVESTLGFSEEVDGKALAGSPSYYTVECESEDEDD